MNDSIKLILIERLLNLFEVAAIALTLTLAFVFEFVFGEAPCPLCLLQRIGFICIAFGLLLNLRFGLRPSHYSIAILSCIFTSFVALRQIALHVVPGTGFYGSAIFGLHLYTWSFILVVLLMIATTIMAGFDRQYRIIKPMRPVVVNILFSIMGLLIISNLVSIVMQCGFSACPDNPLTYK